MDTIDGLKRSETHSEDMDKFYFNIKEVKRPSPLNLTEIIKDRNDYYNRINRNIPKRYL